MTEPDIIRIDGVEYDACPHWRPMCAEKNACPSKCPDDEYRVLGCIRPKRVQMGWVCQRCSPDLCVAAFGSPPTAVIPGICPCDGTKNVAWKPFYGKVVE